MASGAWCTRRERIGRCSWARCSSSWPDQVDGRSTRGLADNGVTTLREPRDMRARRDRALRDLTALFLRLGTTAFGGPAVHIAMLEDEVVRRRRWVTRERFLDLLGATNIIPGPNSTEMAIHIGLDRAGLPGLLVAGVSFILPAAVITFAIAWAYVRFGTLPEASGFLYGAKPAIIAVVLQAVWGLGRTALRSLWLVAGGFAA